MSDDLISRKAVIDILENMMFEKGKNLSSSYLLQDARERISRLSVAFDKEKVIEEMKNAKEEAKQINSRFSALSYEVCIEIAEKGGIE